MASLILGGACLALLIPMSIFTVLRKGEPRGNDNDQGGPAGS